MKAMFLFYLQTTDVDWLDTLVPFVIVIFLVFIVDFYIESFCLSKLESASTGKIGSTASFLSAVIISMLWDQPWAWTMHEWHHGKPSDSHLVSAGTLFAALFFVLGKYRPGARFSKVPKLFGRISGDNFLRIFKTNASRGTKLSSYCNFYSLYNIKTSFTE